MNIKNDVSATPTDPIENESNEITVLDESIRARALRAIQARGKLAVTLMSVATATLVIAGTVYGQQVD
ncbi:MAG: hypothetical protein WA777_19020 [Rhodanobacter sp.]